jgi:6-pyruvoyltetrahydropterin/6-carboxytetrahydropterin synthase
MTFELTRRYRFEAAHWLPHAGPQHKCSRLHGHTYVVEIAVNGAMSPEQGWVIDYASIDAVTEPVLEELDHRCLNEIEGLENPTSEHLALWLWERLETTLSGLALVTVAENPDCSVSYRGGQA